MQRQTREAARRPRLVAGVWSNSLCICAKYLLNSIIQSRAVEVESSNFELEDFGFSSETMQYENVGFIFWIECNL